MDEQESSRCALDDFPMKTALKLYALHPSAAEAEMEASPARHKDWLLPFAFARLRAFQKRKKH